MDNSFQLSRNYISFIISSSTTAYDKLLHFTFKIYFTNQENIYIYVRKIIIKLFNNSDYILKIMRIPKMPRNFYLLFPKKYNLESVLNLVSYLLLFFSVI